MIPRSLRTPFPNTRLSHATPLPGHKSSLNHPLITNGIKLPQPLRDAIAANLRNGFDNCCIAAALVMKCLNRIYRERDQRYRKTCPMDAAAVPYLDHTKSIGHLRAWKLDYHPHDPTLAPTPKLPGGVIKLHLSRKAYEEWKKDFENLVGLFMNREWKIYRSMILGFENMMDVAKRDGTIPPGVWTELKTFWEKNLVGELRKWEMVIDGLNLPSYDDIVGETFDAVLASVEDGAEPWVEIGSSGW